MSARDHKCHTPVYMTNILNILGEFLPGRVSCENAQPKMSSSAIPPTTEEAGPRMRIRRIIFREKYMATAVYDIMKIFEYDRPKKRLANPTGPK